MQPANNAHKEEESKSGSQKHFTATDITGPLAGSGEDTQAAREEAMEDIEQDPDLNNKKPFKDLDEGEAARVGAKDKDNT